MTAGPLTESKTLGTMKPRKGKLERPNRPPPSPNPKFEPRVKDVYCLKWKQTGTITVPEFFTDKAKAQQYAIACNKTLRPNPIQRMLGRYWVVETLRHWRTAR